MGHVHACQPGTFLARESHVSTEKGHLPLSPQTAMGRAHVFQAAVQWYQTGLLKTLKVVFVRQV